MLDCLKLHYRKATCSMHLLLASRYVSSQHRWLWVAAAKSTSLPKRSEEKKCQIQFTVLCDLIVEFVIQKIVLLNQKSSFPRARATKVITEWRNRTKLTSISRILRFQSCILLGCHACTLRLASTRRTRRCTQRLSLRLHLAFAAGWIQFQRVARRSLS